MTRNAIEVSRLTKKYGKRTAVDDLTFEVPWGEVTGFLGPNGAGKSTTMRMITGLAHPTSGEAKVFGRRYSDLDSPSSLVGAALEASALHSGRSARNHLTAIALAGRIPINRVNEVLSTVGLQSDSNRAVGKYSLGMKQRLALATALLGEPDVLILDEPANGLDPAGIRWLRGFVRSYATEGKAVLVSSHLLAELSQMADRVVVIDRGRLVTQAGVEDLTAAASVVSVSTPRAKDLQVLLDAAGIAWVSSGEQELKLSDVTPERVGSIAASAGIPLTRLDLEHQSLEDIFLGLTTSLTRDEETEVAR